MNTSALNTHPLNSASSGSVDLVDGKTYQPMAECAGWAHTSSIGYGDVVHPIATSYGESESLLNPSYGNCSSPPAICDGTAATASLGHGATIQRQTCSGATIPFTWGNGVCVQPVPRIQGFAIQNGVGYGQTIAPVPSVQGHATTNDYGAASTTQHPPTVSGTAWSAATVTGATVHPIAVCRGEVVSRPAYSILDFERDMATAGNFTAPTAFTILEFTRE